jgi:hypothetical protein
MTTFELPTVKMLVIQVQYSFLPDGEFKLAYYPLRGNWQDDVSAYVKMYVYDEVHKAVFVDFRVAEYAPLPDVFQYTADLGEDAVFALCPDCGQSVLDDDRSWKRHFDYCEPHLERVAAEEREDSRLRDIAFGINERQYDEMEFDANAYAESENPAYRD